MGNSDRESKIEVEVVKNPGNNIFVLFSESSRSVPLKGQ